MTTIPTTQEPLSSAPVGIGVLGAARIAPDGIVIPAQATGSRLIAIAARDTARARAFAERHGVARVYDGYDDVIGDEDVELVYNPLANSLHAEWNLRAIGAGKHVLSEKPFARNAAEAEQVRDEGVRAGVVVADGFHYRYHPVFSRMVEIANRGEIGEITSIVANVVIPRPSAEDLRVSPALAGGALMDGGCYALHAVNLASRLTIGAGELQRVDGRPFDDLPTIDETVTAEFALPAGAVGIAHCWMGGDRQELSLRIEGTHGTVSIPDFILPQDDDRVVLTDRTGAIVREEHLGRRSSYTYQLEAVLRSIRYGDPLPTDATDAVQTMRLVDRCYDEIGLPRR
ncbi:Gfo/Idh/MocA family protein [Microbacterium sp.]|uniref:Gfo/Idh/MocA family protein n=1 Tax=Microbacterium sp. TaxID=51671 RepID=UPI0035B05134